jgi:hypothetical protein
MILILFDTVHHLLRPPTLHLSYMYLSPNNGGTAEQEPLRWQMEKQQQERKGEGRRSGRSSQAGAGAGQGRGPGQQMSPEWRTHR